MNEKEVSKSELRRHMRRLLRRLTAEEIAQSSEAICQHITHEIGLLKNVHSIAIYSAHGTEASLVSLHELLPGKALLYPRCHAKRRLSHHHLPDPSELTAGMFGILEPVLGKHEEYPITDIDLILCPGLAFGKDGTRLGHGGGYYDLALKQHTGYIWGIAMNNQLLDSIPHEKHDIPMHAVITEKGITKPA